MARPFKARHLVSIGIGILSLLLAAKGISSDDDDQPINLSPVKSGETKPDNPTPTSMPTVAPTAVPTQAATAAPTQAPTAMPSPTATLVPTPRPRPRHLNHIEGISFSQDSAGISLQVNSSSLLMGHVSVLKNPDRLLVSFHNSEFAGRKVAKEIGQGDAVRARLAQHPGDEVWLVLDLLQPVSYQIKSGLASGFVMELATGALSQASPEPTVGETQHIANLPKVDLMFFDLNVLFQGKQYDRFPCANFIYDKADKFPLRRQFITTLVFHDGYGAFVGNLRIVDPQGNVIDHTRDPIAFNLFSELFDYSAEVPWDIEFPVKGFYSLILTLNGEDVLEHRFYVGHNDDQPEMNSDH